MVWLYANICADNDEKLEQMCPDCYNEVTSTTKTICPRCGKAYVKGDSFTNPNFDKERFEELSKSSI